MGFIRLPGKQVKEIFQAVAKRKSPFAIIIHWPWFYKNWWGFTFGPIIFTKKPDNIAHICHELVHVEQFYNDPLGFWLKYILERIRVGYWDSRFEQQAYDMQNKIKSYLKSQKTGV